MPVVCEIVMTELVADLTLSLKSELYLETFWLFSKEDSLNNRDERSVTRCTRDPISHLIVSIYT